MATDNSFFGLCSLVYIETLVFISFSLPASCEKKKKIKLALTSCYSKYASFFSRSIRYLFLVRSGSVLPLPYFDRTTLLLLSTVTTDAQNPNRSNGKFFAQILGVALVVSSREVDAWEFMEFETIARTPFWL